MKEFSFEPVYNQDDSGSTAFLFDLRNSTKVTRMISWDERLPKHIEFMMDLHEYVYMSLYNNCDSKEFAMNDTGDGYLCIFWDRLHALTCLKVSIYIHDFLEKNLPEHNEALNLEYDSEKLDFGIALHSGGSTINRVKYIHGEISVRKDFMFGIVANTIARLESYTKNYIDYKFLVTGNYRDVFSGQATCPSIKSLFAEDSTHYKKSLGRVNLKDGKNNGHNIYALSQDFLEIFKKDFM